MGVLLPSLGRMREAGNLLGARALLRLGKGDFDGFLADIVTVQQMARRVGSSFATIEQLVAYALDAQVSWAIGAAAGSGRLTSEQCARVRKAMDDAGAMPTGIEQVDLFERWSDLDVEMLVVTGKLEVLTQFFGVAQAQKEYGVFETIDVGEVDWNAAMKQTNGIFDAEVAALQEPTLRAMRNSMNELKAENGIGKRRPAKDLSKESGETREAYTGRVTTAILETVFADLARAIEAGRTARMQEEMALAALAAGMYRAEKGAWPETLGELVPGYLKEEPVDIYLLEPGAVRYMRSGEGIRIYSVGRNGVDEGGVFGKKGVAGDDVGVGVEVGE
jgi:hypothetical protein